jgi:large subunit ribosomal protein L20
MTYSKFMHGLSRAQIDMNRKALSNLAIEDKDAFRAIVDKAKAALEA